MTVSESTGTDLATSLRISVSRLARRMRAERAAQGLVPELADTQLAALAALEKHQVMTPGELAGREQVRPPSMTRVAASLEALGLIQRAPHPVDHRQFTLSLTARGREVLAEVRQLREAWLARRLRELSPVERGALRKALPVLEKLSRS